MVPHRLLSPVNHHHPRRAYQSVQSRVKLCLSMPTLSFQVISTHTIAGFSTFGIFGFVSLMWGWDALRRIDVSALPEVSRTLSRASQTHPTESGRSVHSDGILATSTDIQEFSSS